MGYPTQQEYLDSQEIRSQFGDNKSISAVGSKAKKFINVTAFPGDFNKGYSLDSSFEPIYKGSENEEKTYTVYPTIVGGQQLGEGSQHMPSIKHKYKITAKWEGPSGQGNWNVNKTKV